MSFHRVDGGVSPQVGEQERLGREIFSSNEIRRRAGAGAVNYRAFHDTSSPLALSVDRVDVAQFVRLAEIGRSNALRRGPGRRFHEWGVVTHASAARNGRSVVATPGDENPFHADIRIPRSGTTAEERDSVLRSHAQELASAAVFLPLAFDETRTDTPTD